MIATAILAVGLVLIVEGLVLALAPSRLDDVFRLFARMPLPTRRLVGLAALAAGVTLFALARALGA